MNDGIDQDFLRWQAEWNNQKELDMELVMNNLKKRRFRRRYDLVTTIGALLFVVVCGVWAIDRFGITNPIGPFAILFGGACGAWFFAEQQRLKEYLDSTTDHIARLRLHEESIARRFKRDRWQVVAAVLFSLLWLPYNFISNWDAYEDQPWSILVSVAMVLLLGGLTHVANKQESQRAADRLGSLDRLERELELDE